jgi:hypothetical protein
MFTTGLYSTFPLVIAVRSEPKENVHFVVLCAVELKLWECALYICNVLTHNGTSNIPVRGHS